MVILDISEILNWEIKFSKNFKFVTIPKIMFPFVSLKLKECWISVVHWMERALRETENNSTMPGSSGTLF
jgi:hypothetical protein